MAFAVVAATLASTVSTAMAETPKMSFNKDGKFKIVQFTDTHYCYGNPKSETAVRNINSVVDAEKPDMVVFTGDLVFADSVARGLTAVTQPLVDRGIPFAVVFGNHDHQFDMSYQDMYDLLHNRPYSLMPPRGYVESPDYEVPVYSADGKELKYVLYCLDSHDVLMAKATKVRGYDWLTPDQIEAYNNKSHIYKTANGGNPVPALMFFHIPLPEFEYATKDEKDYVGNKKERVCSPNINTGMYAALRINGDVKGVFCGHDHDNDFVTDYKGVLLSYGRYSGGNTVYNHLGKPGARVIVLDENNPDSIETWIRLRDGEVLNRYQYPRSK